MTDYTEIVEWLRNHSNHNVDCDNCPYCDAETRGYWTCSEELAEQAADAIEELQNRVIVAPVDSYPWLKRKYIVHKADTGEDVHDCFVLRPSKDQAAVIALRAYAKATDNEVLSADIYRWVESLSEQQKKEET